MDDEKKVFRSARELMKVYFPKYMKKKGQKCYDYKCDDAWCYRCHCEICNNSKEAQV